MVKKQEIIGEGYVIRVAAGWIRGSDGRAFYESKHDAKMHVDLPLIQTVLTYSHG